MTPPPGGFPLFPESGARLGTAPGSPLHPVSLARRPATPGALAPPSAQGAASRTPSQSASSQRTEVETTEPLAQGGDTVGTVDDQAPKAAVQRCWPENPVAGEGRLREAAAELGLKAWLEVLLSAEKPQPGSLSPNSRPVRPVLLRTPLAPRPPGSARRAHRALPPAPRGLPAGSPPLLPPATACGSGGAAPLPGRTPARGPPGSRGRAGPGFSPRWHNILFWDYAVRAGLLHPTGPPGAGLRSNLAFTC